MRSKKSAADDFPFSRKNGAGEVLFGVDRHIVGEEKTATEIFRSMEVAAADGDQVIFFGRLGGEVVSVFMADVTVIGFQKMHERKIELFYVIGAEGVRLSAYPAVLIAEVEKVFLRAVEDIQAEVVQLIGRDAVYEQFGIFRFFFGVFIAGKAHFQAQEDFYTILCAMFFERAVFFQKARYPVYFPAFVIGSEIGQIKVIGDDDAGISCFGIDFGDVASADLSATASFFRV